MSYFFLTRARSVSNVTGVMRSTIELGNATFSSIQSASSGSLARAKAPKVRRAVSPLPWMLSHDMTVNGATPAARRRRRPSTTRPKTVAGTASTARSAMIAGFVRSKSPVARSML